MLAQGQSPCCAGTTPQGPMLDAGQRPLCLPRRPQICCWVCCLATVTGWRLPECACAACKASAAPGDNIKLAGCSAHLELVKGKAPPIPLLHVVSHCLAMHNRPQGAGNRPREHLGCLGSAGCSGQTVCQGLDSGRQPLKRLETVCAAPETAWHASPALRLRMCAPR